MAQVSAYTRCTCALSGGRPRDVRVVWSSLLFIATDVSLGGNSLPSKRMRFTFVSLCLLLLPTRKSESKIVCI